MSKGYAGKGTYLVVGVVEMVRRMVRLQVSLGIG